VGARSWSLILVVASLWGGAFALIKIALDDLSPGALAFARTAIAAVALLGIVLARDGAARSALSDLRRRPGAAVLLGLLGTALPYLLIGVGELHVSSGLAAVLLSPVSLFVAGMAPLVDRTEVLARGQAAGFALGLIGVALVVGVDAAGTPAEALGALALLGATASYAAGNLVVKRLYASTPRATAALFGAAASAVLTAPLALAAPPATAPGADTIAAVVVLGLGSTALATLLFYGLIGREGAARAGVTSYLVPPLGLAYGALLLGEAVTAGALAGLPLILAGVWLASRRLRSAVRAEENGPDPCPRTT
jgi:drug/metabolite transporter (DMT)-like permease